MSKQKKRCLAAIVLTPFTIGLFVLSLSEQSGVLTGMGMAIVVINGLLIAANK